MLRRPLIRGTRADRQRTDDHLSATPGFRWTESDSRRVQFSGSLISVDYGINYPVGSRTGAVVLRSLLVCIRGFPLRARLGVSVTPFPAPATSHVACGFAALRAPAHFTSRVMRPMDWTRLSETAVHKTPDTDERVPASHTAIPYSTASSQSPGVVALSLSGAGSSFLPSSECTRNTG